MDPSELLTQAGLRHGLFEGRVDYNFIPASTTDSRQDFQQLVVFVNGLMLPQDGWFPAMAGIIQRCQATGSPSPAMLSYDRAGQGKSGLHPKDLNPEPDSEPGHRHDCKDAAIELGELLGYILQPPNFVESALVKLVLICNSIGCPIGRLYAQQDLQSIAGLVFLDSNITNTDFVSIWPDPDAPGFDASSLPEGVDAEGLRLTRLKFKKLFHPSVPNPEGISRRNLPQLLPNGDFPKLHGSDTEGPFLTVVGHDPQAFAEQSWTVSLRYNMPVA